jgi:hypothetical protein
VNKWGIPKDIEIMVLERDTACVYCGTDFRHTSKTRKDKGSWEHIINDTSITTLENIVICCGSCNSSKGTKSLNQWLQSEYCRRRNINKDTVAGIVKLHIEKYGLGT